MGLTEKLAERIPFEKAVVIADRILEQLRDVCEPGLCVVAGSIRREALTVKDVEILFVPLMRDKQADFFATGEQVSQADIRLEEMFKRGVIAKRKNVDGKTTWGPLNKLAVHVESGIPVDFFTEP